MENVKIGVAGWSYEDWKEIVYPRGLKPGDRLAFIARHFDCVEVNSTFYATPRRDLVARWASIARDRPGFSFTCKVTRTLTHEPGEPAAEAAAFRRAMDPLVESGRLGAALAQFPWFFRFSAENFRKVARLADLFSGLPLVVEVRHSSFLNDEFLSFLRERGTGLANIDLPESRTSLPAASHVFGGVGYFRFHGRNRDAWFDPRAGRDQKYDYLYSEVELRRWVPLIKEAAARADRVFVIANNHYRGQAPANALDLAYLLGDERPAPEPLARAYPHLASRAREGT